MGEHGNKTLCHKAGKLRLNQVESHLVGKIHVFLYEHQIQGEHATIPYGLLLRWKISRRKGWVWGRMLAQTQLIC
jgi:hypothetical protein